MVSIRIWNLHPLKNSLLARLLRFIASFNFYVIRSSNSLSEDETSSPRTLFLRFLSGDGASAFFKAANGSLRTLYGKDALDSISSKLEWIIPVLEALRIRMYHSTSLNQSLITSFLFFS
jgi:hypothetical protein